MLLLARCIHRVHQVAHIITLMLHAQGPLGTRTLAATAAVMSVIPKPAGVLLSPFKLFAVRNASEMLGENSSLKRLKPGEEVLSIGSRVHWNFGKSQDFSLVKSTRARLIVPRHPPR